MASAPINPSPRVAQILLVIMLMVIMAMDMRAIFSDGGLGSTDTTLEEAMALRQALNSDAPLREAKDWLGSVPKGPLAGVLGAAVDSVVDDPLLSVRLVGVVAHSLTLLAVFGLVLRLGGGTLAALLAVLWSGTFSAQYGWFRLEYHDALNALPTVLVIGLLSTGLTRRRHAVLLGLAVGLGALAKTAQPIYLLGPCAMFLALWLRSLRQVAHIGLSLGVFALVLLPWLAAAWSDMALYMDMATGRSVHGWDFKLRLYSYQGLADAWYLYLAAAAGAGATAALGRIPRRNLALLASAPLVTLPLLIFVIDPWSRYAVPLLPVLAVLAALGAAGLLHLLHGRVGPRLAWAALALLTVAPLVKYGHDNLRGISCEFEDRGQCSGMVAPQLVANDGYVRAIRWAAARNLPLFEVHGYPVLHGHRPLAERELWERRGVKTPIMGSPEALKRMRGGGVHLLVCHRSTEPMGPQLMQTRSYDWISLDMAVAVMTQRRKVLKTFKDQNELAYSVVRLQPAAAGQRQ